MTYDYKCTSCEKIWEAIYPMADRDVPLSEPCPHCKAENSVKRCVTSSNVVFDLKGHPIQKCSDGWKDRLSQIKKNSGRYNSIDV